MNEISILVIGTFVVLYAWRRICIQPSSLGEGKDGSVLLLLSVLFQGSFSWSPSSPCFDGSNTLLAAIVSIVRFIPRHRRLPGSSLSGRVGGMGCVQTTKYCTVQSASTSQNSLRIPDLAGFGALTYLADLPLSASQSRDEGIISCGRSEVKPECHLSPPRSFIGDLQAKAAKAELLAALFGERKADLQDFQWFLLSKLTNSASLNKMA